MTHLEIHPMTKKAKQDFEASLQDKTPVRWIMINRPKIRTVQEAVRMLNRHCALYPDIAEKYNAEEIILEELAYERQMVLSLKKSQAIKTLSEWYSRPKTQATYRYQAILKEVAKLPAETLRMEQAEFVRKETADLDTPMKPAEDTTGTISVADYASLAIANLQRRIDDLLEEESALGMELSEECGRLGALSKRIRDTEENIRAIEMAHSIVTAKRRK